PWPGAGPAAGGGARWARLGRPPAGPRPPGGKPPADPALEATAPRAAAILLHLCVEPLQPELAVAPIHAPAAADAAVAKGEGLVAPPAPVTPDDCHALSDVVVGVELAVRPR